MKYLLFCIFCCIVFSSCVKDVDFGDSESIALTPVFELDLIYFTLDEGDFFDEETATARLIVSDTTELRFLDDEFVVDDLKRAEFFFRFSNSIQKDFIAEFQFLNDNDRIRYELTISVQASIDGTPIITEHTEILEGEDIVQLTRTSNVVVNIIIPESIEGLDGLLNLQSKTTYFLEI